MMKRNQRTSRHPGVSTALYGLAVTVVAVAAATVLAVPHAASGVTTTPQALQAELERSLPAGQAPHFYWQVLTAMGYEVEEIDYEKDDYVDFEVVKDREAYEVRLDLEERQSRVRTVEVRLINPDDFDGNLSSDEFAVVAAGTMIPVELGNYLSSEDSERGDEFTLIVTEMVDADVPVGTVIEGKVASVRPAERPRRSGRLVLEATSMRINRGDVPITAAITARGADVDEDDEGIKEDLEDLKEVGIGAAVGAVIGGIVKGTKGALAGLIIGGAGTFMATEGDEVELTAGTPLLIEVLRDIEIPQDR
jgi:hypothetical protein